MTSATHTLTATVDETLYSMYGDVVCHNDPDDPERDCRWGEMVAPGECEHWESTSPEDRWDRRDWPCHGWQWEDLHVHPQPGCGVEWQIENVDRESVAVASPMQAGQGCRVWWQEGCAVLEPVSDLVMGLMLATVIRATEE